MRIPFLLSAFLLWAGIAVSAYAAGARTTGQPPPEPAGSHILEITNASIYPNPFDPFSENATIEFSLTLAAEVEITAYDWAGEYVDTVFKGSGVVGMNTVQWGGQTEDGRKLGNGVYLIRVVASTQARTESTVLRVAVWNDG